MKHNSNLDENSFINRNHLGADGQSSGGQTTPEGGDQGGSVHNPLLEYRLMQQQKFQHKSAEEAIEQERQQMIEQDRQLAERLQVRQTTRKKRKLT